MTMKQQSDGKHDYIITDFLRWNQEQIAKHNRKPYRSGAKL